MKYLLIFLMVVLGCNEKKDSTQLDSLKSIDHKSFVGNNLEEYLKNKNIPDFKNILFVDEPPGKISSVILYYEGEVYLEIYFQDAYEYESNGRHTIEDLVKFYNRKIARIVMMEKDKKIFNTN